MQLNAKTCKSNVYFFHVFRIKILGHCTDHECHCTYLVFMTSYVFGALPKLRIETMSFVTSVYPSVGVSISLSAWNNSTANGQIFMYFDI